MNIHERIKTNREVRQLSQEDMAEKMGISSSSYAKLERGETRLYLDKLQQIANIFQIDVSDLITPNKGVVFYMQGNTESNSQTYYGSSDGIELELEKLKLVIAHKDELLAQKQNEISSLQKIISLLEQRK
jgi:transcriptional regulator with XRE-family HTH domain